MIVHYHHNNSGGSWWLGDAEWLALEKAGWTVEWFRDVKKKDGTPEYPGGRFLGGLARSAYIKAASIEEAIASFEEVTGDDAEAEGCECCGRPHYFYDEPEPDVLDSL